MRDEWGVLHEFEIIKGVPLLTDQELADQLEVDVTTVITHRRD
jgi:DNA-binding CsgD family transcriptional regulator